MRLRGRRMSFAQVLLLSIFSIGCGESVYRVDRHEDKRTKNCSVVDEETTATVVCPDGTSTVLQKQGTPGVEGSQGQAGEAGSSCSVVEHEEGATILCDDGSSAVINHGDNGEDGKVLKVNTQMIYKGYACGRLVFQVGGDVFINNGNPVRLSTKDYSISSTCKVKIDKKKNVVETRT